jgi:hypothetical protein
VELITVDGEQITDAMALFLEPNAIVRRHGVGRRDVVETPGLTGLRAPQHISTSRVSCSTARSGISGTSS